MAILSSLAAEMWELEDLYQAGPDPEDLHPASGMQIMRCSAAAGFPDIHGVSQASGANALQPARLHQHDSHSTADNEAGCGLSPYQGGNPRPAFFVLIPILAGAPGRRMTPTNLTLEVIHG